MATRAAQPQTMMPAPAELAARNRARPAGGGVPREYPLRQMAQRLAAKYITWLDGERVERPEVDLGDPQQRPPSDPSQRDESDQYQYQCGADFRQRQNVPRHLGEPCGRHQRREAEQDRRQQQRDRPGEQQFRQTDFDQQTSGDREQRPLSGARGVVLDIALTRIDGGKHNAFDIRWITSRSGLRHDERPHLASAAEGVSPAETMLSVFEAISAQRTAHAGIIDGDYPPVIARRLGEPYDEAIQPSRDAALNCFASARNDGGEPLFWRPHLFEDIRWNTVNWAAVA